MDELQTLIEALQQQSKSSMVELRYRPDNDEPPWAVIIDWGNKYRSVVPGSAQANPVESLKAAFLYLESQKSGNPV
jgi:hypothetical protein